MKIRNKIFAGLAAVVFAISASGCNFGMLNDNDIETRPPVNDIYCKLTGNISNYTEIILETVNKNDYKPAKNARTIAPALAAENYRIILFGEYGASFCGPFDLTNELLGTNGVFEASIPTGTWNLTLAAFDSSITFSDGKPAGVSMPDRQDCKNGFADIAFLKAKAFVDFTKGTTANVNFVLSPEGLSTKGTVKFNIVLDDWSSLDKGVTAEAGIYDLKTGKEITFNAGTLSTKKALTFAQAAAGAVGVDGASITAGYETSVYDVKDGGTDVEFDPGTYTFILSFKNPATGKTWTWNDRIMIFPGDITDETIFISRLIMEKPEAPEYLYASVATTTDHDATDPYIYRPVTDDSGKLYQVVFDWADWDSTGVSINNETHFELQIADVSGITDTDLTDALDPTLANTKWVDNAGVVEMAFEKNILDLDANGKYQYEGADATYSNWKLKYTTTNVTNGKVNTYSTDLFNIIPEYVDGSLLANNRTVTLYLELGKEYIARIRAVNDTDSSDWTYAALSPVAGHTSPGVAGTPTLSGIAFKGNTINNYYVRYMLNSGSNASGTVSGKYVEYFGPRNSNGLKFIDLYKDGSADGLKRGDIFITGWKNGPESNAEDYYISKPGTSSAVITQTAEATNTGDYKWKRAKVTTESTYNGLERTITAYGYSKETTAPAENGPGWEEIRSDPPMISYSSVSEDYMISYEGSVNLVLWAQYAKSFKWNMVTNYELESSWIKYQVVNADGTDISDAAVTSYDEYTVGGTSLSDPNGNGAYSAVYRPQSGKDYSKIKWTITVPNISGETWNYRYAKVSVIRSDGTESVVTYTETDGVASRGTPTELITDVSDCIQGQYYNVLIEVGMPYSSLTSTIPVVLNVQ